MEAKEPFRNVYEDERRARAYADLAFPGTYALAFRDLPTLIARQVRGRRALDFGCGTGRSTRFLRELGFDTIGVDVSAAMLERARALDPGGDYRQAPAEGPTMLPVTSCDLILSAFTFDNLDLERKRSVLEVLAGRLAPHGRMINVVSSSDIYVNEWSSFSTRDYPENRAARSGDRVKIVMLDVEDQRPVEDILCTDADYLELYGQAGLSVLEALRPLATGEESVAWRSETRIAPWVVYALGAERHPIRP
jgi:SAM-dependent methyltransferase